MHVENREKYGDFMAFLPEEKVFVHAVFHGHDGTVRRRDKDILSVGDLSFRTAEK